jgi:uncharacterized DUF497 family protein
MRFRWDPRKAAENERKHGISFREAATVLRDPLSTTYPDHLHSAGEERFITIGRSAASALLVVVHTEGDQEIRIISARRATKAEQAHHEEGE